MVVVAIKAYIPDIRFMTVYRPMIQIIYVFKAKDPVNYYFSNLKCIISGQMHLFFTIHFVYPENK